MQLLEATALFYILAKTRLKIAQNDNPSLTKVAFDTRHINQEIEYNPRRGLQYYHRSEGFVKKDTAAAVNTFIKLKAAVDELKVQYLGSPEWLDSNCRVLSGSLDRILRVAQGDQEFFEPQLNYLEELMDVRYRLNLNDIERLDNNQIKSAILSKDEKLSNAVLTNNYANITNKPNLYSSSVAVAPQSIQVSGGVDQLVKEILSSVKASADNNEVERSITISVKDKIVK